MVSKIWVSLAAVVLFAVFGTGVLVGMQIGGFGGAPPAAGSAASGQPTTTATPADTDGAAEPTATATPVPDDSADAGPEPIPPREFNEAAIGVAIVENLNDARAEAGLARLSTSGNTAQRVREMAQNHSEAMASAGVVAHTIDGVTSADRYENNDLYRTCQFNVNGNYVERADNNALEVVGGTVAGQPYTANGTQQFNANDTAVAASLTDEWLSAQRQRERILVADAGSIGVGVVVNNRGTVYATVNLCS